MKNFRIFLVLLWAMGLAACENNDPSSESSTPSNPSLKVSDNHRYLTFADGKPFYYLGDTAWELFHRLNREEADLYLEDRAAKGFTVIQAVVLAELEGLTVPNAYGHFPLTDNDPTQPVEDYFAHVDYIVNKAESLGMFIGMLPTWGDKFNIRWGKGPEVFTTENARTYGEFLGNRYKDKPIIWILGGDRNPENDTQLAIVRSMAQGLEAGDNGNHLMTYHPMGGSNSAQFFHNDSWLDFNMFQSGHGRVNEPNYEVNLANYALIPIKPTLDGEPRYEDHPINWKPANGWFDAADVRQAAWWGGLSGSCGHTYGDHNIWQMWQEGREPISAARTPWQQAIHHPGSSQVGFMKQLLEEISWYKLVPAPELIAADTTNGGRKVIAAWATDKSLAMAYTPYGSDVQFDKSLLVTSSFKGYWFDPRTADRLEINGELMETGRFDPPGEPGRGNDWVLVLQKE
ncbi:MAG: glycoside hydrolase family 140 protein [Bacteroidia bacterium]